MTKTTIELLREAREWLSVEEQWCSYSWWGIDGSNCAIGALQRIADPAADLLNWKSRWPSTEEQIIPAIEQLGRAAIALEGVRGVMPSGMSTDHYMRIHVVTVNDERGWLRTLEMFDLAIRRVQEEIDRQAKELVERGHSKDDFGASDF